MDAADVLEVFETVRPEQALKSAIEAVGFQERERKLDAVRLLRAMVIAASRGYGGRQADLMRQYFEMGCERVVRGGFYGWFGPALEAVMKRVRDQALGYVAQHHAMCRAGWAAFGIGSSSTRVRSSWMRDSRANIRGRATMRR